MAKLKILIGNIGSGKTTLVKKYQKEGYVVISRDSLRYGIGNGKYIFNYDYEPIIWNTEEYMFRKFIDLGVNIVIDEVGLTKAMRRRYIGYCLNCSSLGYKITAIVLPRLSMKESVDRRMQDPHGQYDRKLWEGVWTKFNKIYEKPSKNEGLDEVIFLKETKSPLETDCNKCGGDGKVLK